MKNRPKPETIAAALKDISNGMSQYKAAQKHSVSQSSLSRARERIAHSCPLCGSNKKIIK